MLPECMAEKTAGKAKLAAKPLAAVPLIFGLFRPFLRHTVNATTATAKNFFLLETRTNKKSPSKR
jgi:hypothetical protein